MSLSRRPATCAFSLLSRATSLEKSTTPLSNMWTSQCEPSTSVAHPFGALQPAGTRWIFGGGDLVDLASVARVSSWEASIEVRAGSREIRYTAGECFSSVPLR